MSVLSFEQERERIFERWLSRVERLLDRHLDRDAAFDAWAKGYSAAEYAANVASTPNVKQFPRSTPQRDTHIAGMRDEFEGAISDIVALAARVILLAPRECQEALCAQVLHEIGDTVQQIMGAEATTH